MRDGSARKARGTRGRERENEGADASDGGKLTADVLFTMASR